MVSVQLDSAFIADIDREIVLSGFTSRSEFVKMAIRQYLLTLHERRVAMGAVEGAEPQVPKSPGNVGRT